MELKEIPRKLEKHYIDDLCSSKAKSWLEAVIEHLVGRQGQPRRAQLHAMHLSDGKE